jgi:hypothetical protein
MNRQNTLQPDLGGQKSPETHVHGPENAEHEIRKAYNTVVDAALGFFWDRRAIPGVNPHEALTMYKHAFNRLREGNKLAAERWARCSKHLARAFHAEAKLAYLEPRASELPFLDGATAEEFGLSSDARSDMALDLLNSVAEHAPPGYERMPEDMVRYLARARKHLQTIDQLGYHHELLRAERIRAAHEYGRVLECMALAYEAEHQHSKHAA